MKPHFALSVEVYFVVKSENAQNTSLPAGPGIERKRSKGKLIIFSKVAVKAILKIVLPCQ